MLVFYMQLLWHAWAYSSLLFRMLWLTMMWCSDDDTQDLACGLFSMILWCYSCMLRRGEWQEIHKWAERIGLFYDLVGAHTCEGEYVTPYGLGTDSINTIYASGSFVLYNSWGAMGPSWGGWVTDIGLRCRSLVGV